MIRIVTFLAIFLLATSGRAAQSSPTKLIEDLLTRQLLSTDGTEPINRALQFLSTGTRFENHWQANQSIKPDYLNVFLMKPGLRTDPNGPPELKPYYGSCAYLGENSIVLCDLDFLNSFLEKRDIKNDIRDHDSFLVWVLGHELGHIVKSHKAAHFGEDSFEQLVDSTTLDQRQEVEADAFLVERVLTNKDQTTNLARMLIDVLNAEIRSKVGNDLPPGVGIIFDYTNKKIVRYMTLRRHPEFVVRTTRMLQQIGSTKGNESLRSMTDAFAKHLREG